jgi:hypothetical protein
MAVANTPAVALAAPSDSGKGSSSGASSPSSSSGHSGSTLSDSPSAKRALSATNDASSGHRRAHNPPAETTASSSFGPQTTPSTSTSSTGRAGATPETAGTAARQRGGASSGPGSGSVSAKTGPNPAVVNTAAADPTTRGSSRVFTRHTAGVSSASITPSAATPVAALAAAPTSSTAVAPAMAPSQPAPKVITPTPADPVSHLVSTLINAVLSPFANSAPTAPVQPPAGLTLLAFARREFEQSFFNPSTTVNPPAGQTTNGLVTNTVGTTSQDASPAVDPGFISSTRNLFGLFSITSAADPDDNNYVAVVISTPFFTDILTSGADPEDNLGFGAASTGVPGQTVNTFLSPFLNFTIAIPVTDPFAELFTELIRLGIV